MDLNTELAHHLRKMIALKTLDPQTAEDMATTCTKIKDAGGIHLDPIVLLFTIFPEQCAKFFPTPFSTNTNTVPATPTKTNNTNGGGGKLPAGSPQSVYVPPRATTPQPLLEWKAYKKPGNRNCLPFDDAPTLVAKLETALGINLQTPINFSNFQNHHQAVNAMVMALLGLDASNTEIQHTLAAGATAFPNQYACLHMNSNIPVVDLEDNLLPNGYSFFRLKGLTLAELILPTSCTTMITGNEALIHPIILQVAVKCMDTEHGTHTWMSAFVVVHTMANILIPCDHRDASQYPKDPSNRAYHFFVLGHRIASQIEQAPQNRLDDTISEKIGSKIFPVYGAEQPTQSNNRRGLKIIAAHAVLPPNQVPRTYTKHGP